MKVYIALFLLTITSYIYVLNGDFIGDDVGRLLFNKELLSFADAMSGDLADRPLLMFFMTIINKVFGMKTIYYRCFSIAIHALVGYQIYKLINEISKDNNCLFSKTISFWMSAIFCLHPLHSQVITTGIQSGVLLAGVFGLLSIRYAYKQSREEKGIYFSAFFYLLGVLSKPNILFLPVAIGISDFYKKSKISVKKQYLLLFLAISMIPFFFYYFGKRNVQTGTISSFKYFLVQCEVLFTYFRLIFWPVNLQFLYDFNVPDNYLLNINIVYLLIHVLLFYLVIKLIKDKNLKWLFICFYISFVPESSFFPIQYLAFEHRTYFGLVFLTLFFALLLIRLLKKMWINYFIFSCIFVCSLFFVANQNRNLEVKYYRDWALSNLQHSISNSFNNFQFIYLLLRAGNYDDVEPFIKNLQVKHPNKSYEVLRQIQSYFQRKNDKYDTLKALAIELEKDNLSLEARFFINKFIIEEISNGSSEFNLLLRIEKILSNQLAIFFENKVLFKTSISNYSSLVAFLSSGSNYSQFTQDKFNYIKSKVLLYYYYDTKSVGLEREILDLISRAPKDVKLYELYQLIIKKSKGSF